MAEHREEQVNTADGTEMSNRGGDAVNEDVITETTAASTPRLYQEGTKADTGGQTWVFPAERAQELRSRLDSIQVGFVDEPRRAVEQADSLIAEVVESLTTALADERARLEDEWDRGDDVSTEDLRLGFRRYRSFFDRLLTI